MKKIAGFVLVFLMMLTAVPAHSQLRFGVKGGINISSVHLNSDLLQAENVTGFQIGPMLEASIPLLGIGFDAALLYSQKGVDMKAKANAITSSATVKTDYIDFPVNLKWKFGLPIVKGFLTAGPYVGFRIGGDKTWDILGEQIKAQSFSAGLNFGAGLELIKHLQVGVNYGLGLTDNYSAEKLNLNAKNRGWSMTATVLF